MLLSTIYICSIAVAFGCSIVGFALHSKHLKVLSVIIGFDLLGELAGKYLYSLIQNNIPAYNVILLGEFVGYAYFFYLLTKLHWFKKITIWFIILFPIFWFVLVFIVFGFLSWNSYVYAIGSLFTIFFAIIYYYELIKDQEIQKLGNVSEFWIATGLIIFFAANLPYMGMYNFLTVNYPDLAKSFGTLLLFLNIIMYSLFACAYLWRKIPTMK